MNSVKKYWAIFRITLINNLAYPGELIGRSLLMIPFMWVFFQLWKVTFSAAGVEAINGMTLHGTMWYLMMAETIELSRPRLANTISENVKDGSIAYILNKPYNFLLYQFSSSMGETIFRAAMNAVIGTIMVWWLVGETPPSLGWIYALPALLGTWIMNFCITCLIGLSAFLVEEVSPYLWIYQKLVFILGGFLIPLDFYPSWLQTLAKALPFPYMIYGPAKLLIAPSNDFLIHILSLQTIWILVLSMVLIGAYRRGITYLTVNGG